ncbi:tRNA uridine-5-carboxymethylaminomethyl(34) synthesis enzyme MnmG [Pseudooceanicola sp.]|uniref:tRNA uridine-5-carboxymethylaminomethyl(34) synthesis enzyme MnmG n=1 Tax=Pseudooceanicola sp. TaxID=1914328 RepID=UPI0040581ADD
MKHSHFDVVVIGGGHAGCEAATASARMGARTALITLKKAGIGVMSCNPAIGGLGKGHLVREIDAMDGVMGRVADKAGIQFRLLNRRKGPAVQGPRTQADRAVYRSTMLSEIERTPNLSVIEGEVADLLDEKGVISGIVLHDGVEIRSSAVVLTTGTFLRGVIHIGEQSHAGGRMGDAPSTKLAERIDDYALPLGRLKTGTPPRLDGRTINWEILETQPGDVDPVFFSFLSNSVSSAQISCGITHTNEKTHEIIQRNLAKSAMYGGFIDGVGPRYCPSIEDKVVRFAEKTSHQVFLEPEGLNDHTVYPNGISTSLPLDVQELYIRSIRGLEQAEIVQPGYAIEYDYVDPQALNLSLAVRSLQGLYLAGQINGTTGYEEAAAQGLVAGLNAAATALDKPRVEFGRSESYMGVMIDDLTTRGVTEPYRMFTSRAEFRLSLRADNADQRLTPKGLEIGCVGRRRQTYFTEKTERLASGQKAMSDKYFSPQDVAKAGKRLSQDGSRRTAYQLLGLPNIDFDDLVKLDSSLGCIDIETRAQLGRDALYATYIERQNQDVAVTKRDEAHLIPAALIFSELDGLSNELKVKLERQRPSNIAQASRVEGMTPAALMLIMARIRRDAKLPATA